MTPLAACRHRCCTEPDDAPPHEHRPYPDPRTCPDCIELAKQDRPTPAAQKVADRAKAFGERYGRPDRNTRRDP